MKKTSINLSSRICPKVDSDYPRGTCENVVYHSHVTNQTIITSYLRPVAMQYVILVTPDEVDKWYAICIEVPNAEITARIPTTIAL